MCRTKVKIDLSFLGAFSHLWSVKKSVTSWGRSSAGSCDPGQSEVQVLTLINQDLHHRPRRNLCFANSLVWFSGTVSLRVHVRCRPHRITRGIKLPRVFITQASRGKASKTFQTGLIFFRKSSPLDGQTIPIKQSSQPINLPGTWPIMKPLITLTWIQSHIVGYSETGNTVGGTWAN